MRWRAATSACRHHALTRPTYAEAEATHRAIALARAADASVYIVHLSCADALAEVAAAKARGWPVYARDLPPLPGPDRCPICRSRRAEVIEARHLAAAPRRGGPGRAVAGLARGGLDLVASDHVPDRLAVEKRCPAPPFPQISNGAPGIETLLSVVYGEGVATGRITRRADGRPAGHDAGAPVRPADQGCDRGRARRRPRPVRPGSARARSARRTSTTPATSRPTRASRSEVHQSAS